MPDHNEFFRRGHEEYDPDQMRERPSNELKVRIRPNQVNIRYAALSTELRNSHNMELSRSNSDRNIIVVSGIPPTTGFGEHEVMQVVRRYAPLATVVPA